MIKDDFVKAKEPIINIKTDITPFIEQLEYARNLLENASYNEQACNVIIGAANVLEGSEFGEQFRVLCDYAKKSNNDEGIIRLSQYLNELLSETIASLEDIQIKSIKKWWEFWK